MSLPIHRTIAELRSHHDALRSDGRSIGFVPTMGYLHEGHLSLIRRARADNDVVVVSIFVNPLQFAPDEDLSTYPRDLERDTQLAESAGADHLFVPTVEEMYPFGPVLTSVSVPSLAAGLEGHSRPTHFDGVATVVTKLFSIVGACRAYFGEKDFQQLAIVRRMVADLSLPVEVVPCPIARDDDGLALSSRNVFLTDEERRVAPVLKAALDAGAAAIVDDGLQEPSAVEAVMAAVIDAEPLAALDYAAAVDAATLERPPRLSGECRLLVAVGLGTPRLIDNLAVSVPAHASDSAAASPAAEPQMAASPYGATRVRRWTAPSIRATKRDPEHRPLVMVTAYDTPSAKIASDAGVDLILVGDSLAMVVLGHNDTLQVSVADLAYHTAAVRRADPAPFVVGDLPWMAYHTTVEASIENAATILRAGADAVKLEGGRRRLPMIEGILNAEIPVMGHLGLTPQSTHMMGGFKVQAKEELAARELLADSLALAEAGCFSIVFEGVPREVATWVSEQVPVPTIGIGAGPDCDGQVLVYHDVLGVQNELAPRFVRRYANIEQQSIDALRRYSADVRARRFPGDAESYHAKAEIVQALVDDR